MRIKVNYDELPVGKSYYNNTDDSCLVNFIAAETSDESNVKGAAKKTADMIADAAEEVKETNTKYFVIHEYIQIHELT